MSSSLPSMTSSSARPSSSRICTWCASNERITLGGVQFSGTPAGNWPGLTIFITVWSDFKTATTEARDQEKWVRKRCVSRAAGVRQSSNQHEWKRVTRRRACPCWSKYVTHLVIVANLSGVHRTSQPKILLIAAICYNYIMLLPVRVVSNLPSRRFETHLENSVVVGKLKNSFHTRHQFSPCRILLQEEVDLPPSLESHVPTQVVVGSYAYNCVALPSKPVMQTSTFSGNHAEHRI